MWLFLIAAINQSRNSKSSHPSEREREREMAAKSQINKLQSHDQSNSVCDQQKWINIKNGNTNGYKSIESDHISTSSPEHTKSSSTILSKVSIYSKDDSIKSNKLTVKPIILPKPQKISTSFVFNNNSHPSVLKKSSLPNNSPTTTPSSHLLDHRNSLPASPIHDKPDESYSSPSSPMSTSSSSPTMSLSTLPKKPTSFLHSMQTNLLYADHQTKSNDSNNDRNSNFPPSIKPKPPVPFKPAKLREQLLHSLASESLTRNKVVTSSINSCSSSQPDSRELSSPCGSINEKISSFHQEFVNNYQPPSKGLVRVSEPSSVKLNTSSSARTSKRQSSSSSGSFLYKYLSPETPQSSEEEPDQLSLSSASSNTVSEANNVVSDPLQSASTSTTLKKAKDPFDVAKEIADTEASFVDDLTILVDLGELMRSFFTSDVVKSIICQVPELMSVHVLLRDKLRERIGEWKKTPQICDILLETGPYLKVHNFYAKDFSEIHKRLENATKNSGFAKALKEFQKERCRQLCVRDFMHKAVKRLPEIKLLLDRYKKYLPPDHVDRKNCLQALKLFSEINKSAEELICQADSTYVLIGIQSSMVKGSSDIVKPGRILLKVGELMKISRRQEQPRKFVLCSDCLIYLTQHQLGSYRLNHELKLDTMVVAPNPQFETEFNIISQTRSIPVRAASVEERQQWIDAIQKAINEFQTSRGSIRKSLVTGQLGDTAPIWVPDNRVTMCQDCCNEFTLSFRRHHCRACGRVVCSDCSSNQAPLKYLNYKSSRVCDKCFSILQKNFSQMEKLSVPTIQKGSSSELSIDLSPENSTSANDSIDQEPDLDQLKNGFVRMPLRASHRRKEKPTRLMISADDKSCSISGYLSFKENDQKKWKKGWFVVKENVIYRFKQSNDTAALESLAILGYHVEIVPDKKVLNSSERGHLFQLSHPGQSTMTFKADSLESAKKWTEEMLTNTRIS